MLSLFYFFLLDAFLGRRSQTHSFVNHIVWLSGFANRGTWGVLFCWPSAPPSSWINPTDTPWQKWDRQQVQRDAQLWWSLHVGRLLAHMGERHPGSSSISDLPPSWSTLEQGIESPPASQMLCEDNKTFPPDNEERYNYLLSKFHNMCPSIWFQGQ